MGNSPRGPMLRQVLLKVKSWAQYFFLTISITYQKVSSNVILIPDDTLFSVIHDSSTTGNELNDDLVKINVWAYQWKMSFNPDPNK